MKPIKILGLAVLAMSITMAVTSATAAMATSTALCKTDESPCIAGNRITHLHAATAAELPSLILTTSGTVECAVLYLGDTLNNGLGSPLVLHGTFTYTCENGCSVTEENGPGALILLKTGHDKAEATLQWLIHVTCGINCRYDGEGLKGTFKGALLPFFEEEDFGEAALHKESGFFCPVAAELDLLVFSLETFYIST